MNTSFQGAFVFPLFLRWERDLAPTKIFAVAKFCLAAASRFCLLAKHRSGVQILTRAKQFARLSLLFYCGGRGI